MGGTASDVDLLFKEALAAGSSPGRIRGWLLERQPDEATLLSLLRRAVSPALLETLARTPPFSEWPRLLGGVALNPRSPRSLALKLLPSLYWRDLAEIAARLHLAPAVRFRAESLLLESLAEMRLGDRIALARLATPAVLRSLIADAEPKVVHAALRNPRLPEAELLLALRTPEPPATLIGEVAACARWRDCYAVRLALVLQPATPLALALAQLTSLTRPDLLRVAGTPRLRPLVQASAGRVAEAMKSLHEMD